MSDIKHHITPALMMGYAAGGLPEAINLVIATHVSICDECRASLAEYESIGGSVVETTEAAAMSAGSLEATLALLGAQDRPAAPKRPAAHGVFPAPLRDYAGGDAADVRWKSLGGGVKQRILQADSYGSVRLLKIPGGVAVPDHGHKGIELTLVLQGAFSDDTGHFGRGDVEIADQSLEHTPIAEPGADCICLAATDAPLRFNSLIPRLLQPLFKI